MAELQLYTPHANQIKIHESKHKNRVVVAGRRFGKSALALNEALATAFQLPNQIIWIILPLFRQAKEIYWIDPDITKYYMPYATAGLIEINQQELSLRVKKTNSWIRLKGSDNYDSLRGSGIDRVFWDEVDDIKDQAFETIRPALADSPNHKSLYIGTPKGLGTLHDLALRGNHDGRIPTFEKQIKLNSDYKTWHYTSYDNLSWPEGSPERVAFIKYIEQQKQEAEEKGRLGFFNQEYLASFEESGGRFFPKWAYNTHVIDSFIPKQQYIRFGSIDWGRTAPMAWYAHALIPTKYQGTNFNRVITFKEVYQGGKSPYEQAKDITEEINYLTIHKTYYDPSMVTPQSDGSMSVADQFKQAFNQINNKMPVLEAASNKRVSRWAAMDNWMRIAPDGLPYWLITKNCKNLIRTIPLMVPDDNNIEDLDTTLEDHAIDSAGYFLQYMKWIDAKVGAIKPKYPSKYKEVLPTTKEGDLLSLDMKLFEKKNKRGRSWKAI